MIQRQNITRGVRDEGDTFIESYIYERLVKKHTLEPEDFGKLEMNFRRNWHPSFRDGWVRHGRVTGASLGSRAATERGTTKEISRSTSERPKSVAVIEADALFGSLPIRLFGWEKVNVSACFVDFAIKAGFNGDFDSIRAHATELYSSASERNRVVLEGLNILLEEYPKPNTYAPNRALVEKARNALHGR